MLIYKVLRNAEWATMQRDGATAGAPVDLADGYIHFSTAEQVDVTLHKHFRGEDGLTLLACAADTFGSELRWEPSRGGALFPHLYRPLRMDEVQWWRPILLTPQGHDTGAL
nr:DUF952 domain-containing protein [Paracoccus saliphilus]